MACFDVQLKHVAVPEDSAGTLPKTASGSLSIGCEIIKLLASKESHELRNAY